METIDLGNTMPTIQIRVKDYKFKIDVELSNDRLFLKAPYHVDLIEEIKCLEGPKWHGFDKFNPRKQWSIANSQHNLFRLEYLSWLCNKIPEKNPYRNFEKSLKEYIDCGRKLYKHQINIQRFENTRRYCIVAAEMGCGKTLPTIELMEIMGTEDWIWVGPKSALIAVQSEFEKWKARYWPRAFLTYEALKKWLANYNPKSKAPIGVVFDESQRIKTATSQRGQAAAYLADNIRTDWGESGSVILLTGTPAPKSPLDWQHQCRVAWPGFLREGNPAKFRDRLGVFFKTEDMSYSKLLAWKDGPKCEKCGKSKEDTAHDFQNPLSIINNTYHEYKECENEVAKLYKRMDGLVTVIFKKDVLAELPDKQYRIIRVEPTQQTLRLVDMIAGLSKTTIQALTLLRELSDGFQYQESEIGWLPCPQCQGNKIESNYVDNEGNISPVKNEQFKEEITLPCHICSGVGEITKTQREAKYIGSPKEQIILDLMEEYEDRHICYAGFTGSIDICVNIYRKQNWDVVRVDGRGWQYFGNDPTIRTSQQMYALFQNKNKDNKVAFVAHPKTGGIGLTLTASPMALYYSNDFNGEARAQSEDRGHRPGMDMNKGFTIIDIFHLPSDEKVYQNLKQKRKLELMTLGEFVNVPSGKESIRN